MKYWIGLISTLTVIILFYAFFVFDKDVTLERWVVTGSSEHWRARIESSRYQAFWEDKDGKLKYESNNSSKYLVVYKGNNPEKVGEVKYEINRGRGKTSGSTYLSKDGIISGYSSGGNTYIEEKDVLVSVTVQWDGRKETFELKSK